VESTWNVKRFARSLPYRNHRRGDGWSERRPGSHHHLLEQRGRRLRDATGTGYLALAAASVGHRVTAVDLASTMIDELFASAAARGLAVDARLGDAVAPDFPPGSFDAVTSRHLRGAL